MGDNVERNAATGRIQRVADTSAPESVPARLAAVRDQLKLLADYL